MIKIKPEDMPDLEALKAQIDENLKKAYQRVLTEEVPDKFLTLLDQLRAKEDAEALK